MRPTASPQQAEKRQARRFAVMLPVKLDQGNGWTRNVSASGVFFKLFYDAAPPFLPGSLNFNVDLNKDVVLTNIPTEQGEPKQHMLALPACVASVVEQLNIIPRP